MITFTVPGQPEGKGRPKFARRGAFVKAYTPAQTASYENLIKLCYEKSNPGNFLLKEPLKMTIKAYYFIPLSWSNKKRLSALEGKIKPTVKADLDNVIKIIADSLNKVAYEDDKQIISIYAIKKYDVAPRVEISIEEVSNE